MNAWEETMLDSVGDVSGSEKENVNDDENNEFNAGSDNVSVNDEANQSNRLAHLLHQAAQSNDPVAHLVSQATQEAGQGISARLQGGTEVEVNLDSSAQRRPRGDVGLADFSTDNQNPTTGKFTRKRRPTTPDY